MEKFKYTAEVIIRNIYAGKISIKTQHGELKCTPTFFLYDVFAQHSIIGIFFCVFRFHGGRCVDEVSSNFVLLCDLFDWKTECSEVLNDFS